MGGAQSVPPVRAAQPAGAALQQHVDAPLVVTKDHLHVPKNSPKHVWGPATWRHLHLRAIAWRANPTLQQIMEEHKHLQRIFATLQCPECQVHATLYYDNNPPQMCTSQYYQLWVFTFHNHVNERLGKPQMQWEEYEELYRAEILKLR